jgi:hypothetical protein
LAAHGIDIRKAVRCGDTAVIIGIIHYGCKEVSRYHQGAPRIQPPDGGIIGFIEANQQVWIIAGIKDFFNRAQNLRQRFRVQFRSSTCTIRITGQPDLAPCWVNN